MANKKIKILVIDDLQDNLIISNALIKDAFPDAISLNALNGKTGLNLAAKEDPDVILLDIIMPEMDGYEVCKKLKADKKLRDIPVVFVTANKDTKENRIRALEFGGEAFLTKPIDEIELTAQIRAMLKIRNANIQKRDEKEHLTQLVEEKTHELNKSYRGTLNLLEDLKKEVSERKKTENVLKENQDRLNRGEKIGKIGNWEYDFRTNNIIWSDQVFELYERNHELGPPSDDEVGKYYSEEVHKRLRTYIQKIIETGNPVENYYCPVILPSGKTIMCIGSMFPTMDKNGSVIKIFGVLQDITERKQAEEKLKESEERFQLAMKAANDGLFDWNIETNAIYYSPGWKKMLGYEDHELLNDFTVWEKTTEPKDVKNSWELQQKLISGEIDRFVLEFKMKHKDGHWVDILSRAEAIFNDIGKAIRIVGTHTDITESKLAEAKLMESEERFKVVTESAGEWIWEVDNAGMYTFSSPMVENLLGYKPEEIVGKKHFYDSFKDDVKKELKEGAFSVFKQKLIFKDFENPNIHKNGQIVILNTSGSPILDKEGSLIGYRGADSDITNAKHAKEKLLTNQFYLSKAQEIGIIGTWELNIQKNILIWTDENYKIFGIPIGTEMTYDLFLNCIHPEDRDYVQENWSAALKKEPYDIEHRLLINDKVKWVREKADIEFNSEGNPIIAIGVTQDITERKQAEETRIAQLRLISFSTDHTVMELLQKFLDEAETITNSEIGFFHFVDDDQQSITLQAWSTNTLKNMCSIEGEDRHYPISKAGVWVDCVHQRKPVIHNDYESLLHKKGLPAGHSPIIRELVVPVIRGEKITAVLGVGNKKTYYDKNDVTTIQTLADVAWEIVERKIAEEKLLKSEEQNRSITQTAADAIISINSAGIILSWNEAAEKIFGYSLSEMMNEDLTEIIPLHHIAGHNAGIQRLIEGGKEKLMGKTIELTGLRKNKTEFPIDLSLSSWESDNQKYYTGIIRDITKRKRAEQIQKVLYNISNAVITIDNLKKLTKQIQKELGKIIDTTNFYIAIYDDKTDMFSLPFAADEKEDFKSFPAGKSFSKYVLKTQKPLLANKEKVKEMVKTGNVELVGTASEVWLGVPLKLEEKVVGVLAVQSYTDEFAYNDSDKDMFAFIADQISISIERKKAEEELLLALKHATESDRLKSAFLANMSHEIRTPMNGILGFSELLKEPGLSGDQQQKYIKIIEKSGARMLNIINDIVDISKIEAGLMQVILKDSNIHEQIEFIYTFFKPEVEAKGMKLSFRNAFPAKEFIVKTDREKIFAILTNLVKNAIKYSTQGSIEFGYNITDSLHERSLVEFYVKDTGIGIPKDRQEAIFERFIQVDIEDKMAYQGAGLGLSISKAYVEILGGKMWVESEEGKGSTFYFTIPYNTLPEQEIASKNIDAAGVEALNLNLKILIAEDEEISGMLLEIMVNPFAKEILNASTGLEAIAACRNNPDIDLILMDIQMPGMNGIEATQKIREFNNDVIIIAQTAFGLAGDREKALEAGCNDYISKPINKTKLLALIQKYFKK